MCKLIKNEMQLAELSSQLIAKHSQSGNEMLKVLIVTLSQRFTYSSSSKTVFGKKQKEIFILKIQSSRGAIKTR